MKQLKSIASSFAKYYLTALLTLIVAHGGVTGFQWQHALESSLVAALPVIINALNPNYDKYGVHKTKPNETAN